MNYDKLAFDIDRWLKDYYYMHAIKAFVVGVSGGIDSAVVSTLCAKTELPTYVMTMPLHSKEENTELSELHAYGLVEKYSNVTLVNCVQSIPDPLPLAVIIIILCPSSYNLLTCSTIKGNGVDSRYPGLLSDLRSGVSQIVPSKSKQ